MNTFNARWSRCHLTITLLSHLQICRLNTYVRILKTYEMAPAPAVVRGRIHVLNFYFCSRHTRNKEGVLSSTTESPLWEKKDMCWTPITLLFISLMVISMHTSTGAIVAHNYHRAVASDDCVLILTCSFQQVSARNKLECALLSVSLEAGGYHFTSSTGACNICKTGSSPTASFVKINSDLRYFAESRWISFFGLPKKMFLV